MERKNERPKAAVFDAMELKTKNSKLKTHPTRFASEAR
jgi:hypothetical protein